MEIFQTLLKYFELLGVCKAQLLKKHVFNLRNMLGLFIFGQHTVLNCVFLLFEADSFAKYTDSYYISSTVFGATLNYVYVVINMGKVFVLIKNLENVIMKSEIYV